MSSTNQSRDLLSMSTDEKSVFLDSFDYIFADCDGTAWSMVGDLLNGTGAAITKLQEIGKKVIFVTNNSFVNKNNFEIFKQHGINTSPDEIIYPPASTVHYLKNINFKGNIYVMGSAAKDVLKAAGFNVINTTEELEIDGYYWKETKYSKPVQAVVLDLDKDITLTMLSRAEVYLRDSNCFLIVGATEKYLPVPEMCALGPGYLYRMLAEASKKEPIIIGKPGVELKDILLDKFNITNGKRVLFVGDMLEPDIEFGKLCGFQTLLVLTGATDKETMTNTQQEYLPDYYINTFADIMELVNEVTSGKQIDKMC